MNIYGVITADVISSKKTQQYSNIETLNSKANSVTKKLKELGVDLFTEVSISRGDEIQVVCENIEDIPRVLRIIRGEFYPCKLRIGVGIGTIDNIEFSQRDTDKNSWDYNGEAFFAARKAVDKIKNNKEIATVFHIYETDQQDILDILDDINVIYELINVIISKWRDTQWRYTESYEIFGKMELASKNCNIKVQTMSRSVNTAKWRQIESSENYVKTRLRKIKSIFRY